MKERQPTPSPCNPFAARTDLGGLREDAAELQLTWQEAARLYSRIWSLSRKGREASRLAAMARRTGASMRTEDGREIASHVAQSQDPLDLARRAVGLSKATLWACRQRIADLVEP